jgi:hypothetical protein
MKLETPQPSDFDPYYRWLGIPKRLRPPNHYQLLGISPEEGDHEIIEAAVERQTNLVKTQRDAEHDAIATRILYEIQEAGMVVLDSYRRQEYDASLAQSKAAPTQRLVAEPLPPAPAKSVGEQNEIVRSYLGIVSVLVAAFIIMAVVSFMLPWRRVVFRIPDEKTSVVAKDGGQAGQQVVRQPIRAQRPVAMIAGGPQGVHVAKVVAVPQKGIADATGMKPVLVSAGSEKSTDHPTLPTKESQRAFEQSLPGKYRLELIDIESGDSNNSMTLELHPDMTFIASDGHSGTWSTSGTQLIMKNSDPDIESGPATREKNGVLTGTLTTKANGRKGRYRLTRTETEPPPPENVGPRILEHRTVTWEKSKDNYASYVDSSFNVGMGNARDGYGFAHAGTLLENVGTLEVEVTMSKRFRRLDENSFAGFIVDYHTSSGFVSRVALSTGFSSQKRWATSPWWGKATKPDRFAELGKSKRYRLDLHKWAPLGWDGQCWFSVNLQNSGTNTSLQARITQMAQ